MVLLDDDGPQVIKGLQHHAEARNEAHEQSPSEGALTAVSSGWHLGQLRRDTVQPLRQTQSDDGDKVL